MPRREDGVSTVELAFILPVILILLAVTVPLVQAGWQYLSLSRATAHGVRYATRADVNARGSAAGLTRRPTADEVAAFVRDAAGGIAIETVNVTPEPAGALPGEVITVSASHRITFGPLATGANALKGLFFGGGAYLPHETVVTVTAQGREE